MYRRTSFSLKGPMPLPKKDILYPTLAETIRESSTDMIAHMPEHRDADVERRFLRIIEGLESAERAETHFAERVIVRGTLKAFNDLKSMLEEQGIALGPLEKVEATLRGHWRKLEREKGQHPAYRTRLNYGKMAKMVDRIATSLDIDIANDMEEDVDLARLLAEDAPPELSRTSAALADVEAALEVARDGVYNGRSELLAAQQVHGTLTEAIQVLREENLLPTAVLEQMARDVQRAIKDLERDTPSHLGRN